MGTTSRVAWRTKPAHAAAAVGLLKVGDAIVRPTLCGDLAAPKVRSERHVLPGFHGGG